MNYNKADNHAAELKSLLDSGLLTQEEYNEKMAKLQNGGKSNKEILAETKALLDDGLITEEEYNKKKEEILARM